MVRHNWLLFVFIFLVSFELRAQQFAEGSVVSKSTGEPIPYVNVYPKKYPYLGTITNLDGTFRLRTYSQSNDSVVFSHVGFKRKAFSTEYFSTPRKIRLDELEKMLSEVIIMPDSSLRVLLRKAYNAIEKNYPTKGTLFEGFYRETNQIVGEQKFIYFSESTIEFYKPTYNNRNFGPVRIIKGGKAEVDTRRSFSNVYFYAGAYSGQSKDFVKQRAEFINPSTFHLYDYAIEGVMKDGDREIMDISFKPKDGRRKAEYFGRFQLDRTTLAYISAQFNLTPLGLQNHNRHIFEIVKDTRISYDVRYRQIDDRWHLSSVVYDGELYNLHYKNHLRHTAEFVTTSVKLVDENPIRESEAISYTAIYTDQKSKFTDDYWNSSDVLVRDSTLEKQVQLLFKKNELSLKEDTTSSTAPGLVSSQARANTNHKALSVLSRFSSNLSVGIIPVATTGGIWSVNYANALSTRRNIESSAYVWYYDTDLKYKINRSFSVLLNLSGSISRTKQFGMTTIGIDYRKRIVGWRLPLWFHASVGVGPTFIQQELGRSVPTEDFTAHNTKFVAGKEVSILVGRRGYGVVPTLQLNYAIKPRLQIYGGVIFYSPITSNDKLWFTQKKNWYSSTNASVKFDDPKLDFNIDGNEQKISPIRFRDFPTMFRVGFTLAID